MDLVAGSAEARDLAERFQTSTDIHAEDFIFQFHLDALKGDEQRAIEVYIADGQRSARQLDEVIGRFHPAGAQRRSILEFASG